MGKNIYDYIEQSEYDVVDYILQKECQLDEEELYDIIIANSYDLDFVYDKIHYADYSIYTYNNLSDLGEELYNIYDVYSITDRLKRYFNFELYAEDFINEQPNLIELSDEKLIVFY